MKINYTLTDNNIINSWNSIPFDESKNWIEIEDPSIINIGFDKIIDNKLVQDIDGFKNEKLKRNNISSIVIQLKQLRKSLDLSDYKVIKYLEGYLTEEEYLPIKAQRQQARDDINRLELELNELLK